MRGAAVLKVVVVDQAGYNLFRFHFKGRKKKKNSFVWIT